MKYRELMLISVASLTFFKIIKYKRSLKSQKRIVIPKKSPAILLKEKQIRDYAELRGVVYIAIQKKIYYAKDADGQPVLWSHSMMETMAALQWECNVNCVSFKINASQNPLFS